MATMSFGLSLRRLLPLLGYHHILMMVLITAIIMLSLLVAGTTSASPAIPGIYLTSFRYQNITLAANQTSNPGEISGNVTDIFATLVNGTQLEVRASYFGLCVKGENGIWLCNSDAAGLQTQFKQDPLQLIAASAKFKESIVFPGLIIMVIVLALFSVVILATFPGWREEVDERGSEIDVKPFPSKKVSMAAFGSTALASLIMLVSIIWQHTASVASATTAEMLWYGSVKSEVGATAIALGWTGFALTSIAGLGLYLSIRSIEMLERLTDD